MRSHLADTLLSCRLSNKKSLAPVHPPMARLCRCLHPDAPGHERNAFAYAGLEGQLALPWFSAKIFRGRKRPVGSKSQVSVGLASAGTSFTLLQTSPYRQDRSRQRHPISTYIGSSIWFRATRACRPFSREATHLGTHAQWNCTTSWLPDKSGLPS